MPDLQDDPLISNPTYMCHIRHFFIAEDIDHMQKKGIDLGTYAGVKEHAVQIYSAVIPPARMPPPDLQRPWSANRCQTFLNWITNDYPIGVPDAARLNLLAASAPARLRKNVANLSPQEEVLLKKAFTEILARPDSDPASYFALAGIHGLPKLFCQHHNDPYNPWHRVYLKLFEDALRSVDGCEDVTLPYWDMSQPIPPLLLAPPFDSYTFPSPVGPYSAGDKTERFSQARIDANLTRFNFFGDFATALLQTRWGRYGDNHSGFGFQQFSIQSHDAGHVSTGPTMSDQDVAAYDPIFWFY